MPFLLNQQQSYREGYHGHTPIHNSLKENKISRNKPNQGSECPLSENFKSLEEEIEMDTRKMERYPMLIDW